VQHAVKTGSAAGLGVYLKGCADGMAEASRRRPGVVCVQGSGELVMETASAGRAAHSALDGSGGAGAARVFYEVIAGSQGMVLLGSLEVPRRVVEKG